MSDLMAGRVVPTDFAVEWIRAGAQAQRNGEGLREAFERIFSDVFYVCDAFPLDLDDRAPDEPTEEELREVVAGALDALERLEVGSHRG